MQLPTHFPCPYGDDTCSGDCVPEKVWRSMELYVILSAADAKDIGAHYFGPFANEEKAEIFADGYVNAYVTDDYGVDQYLSRIHGAEEYLKHFNREVKNGIR